MIVSKKGVERPEPVAATLTTPDTMTTVLDPTDDLPKGAYRATIAAGVTDTAGNPLAGTPYTWRFTVGK